MKIYYTESQSDKRNLANIEYQAKESKLITAIKEYMEAHLGWEFVDICGDDEHKQEAVIVTDEREFEWFCEDLKIISQFIKATTKTSEDITIYL